jgi:hypothetical protein
MLDGWTLTESKTGPKGAERPFHTWTHPNGKIHVRGEPTAHARSKSWYAYNGKTPLLTKEYRERHQGRQLRGNLRLFATAEAAARAAVEQWGDG